MSDKPTDWIPKDITDPVFIFNFEEAWKEVTRKYLMEHGIVPTGDYKLNEKIAMHHATQSGIDHTNKSSDLGPNAENLYYLDQEAVRKAKDEK